MAAPPPVPPHEAIRNLLGRYCEAMDAGAFDELGALFAEGRLVDEHGGLVAAGADAVTRLYADGTRLYGGVPGTRHITANPIIDLDPDGAGASVRSSFIVFQAAPDLPLQAIIAGRYRDRFLCGADGAWRFAERAFVLDQVGDLSHHLTYAVPT